MKPRSKADKIRSIKNRGIDLELGMAVLNGHKVPTRARSINQRLSNFLSKVTKWQT